MKIFSFRKPFLGRVDKNLDGVIHGWAHDPNNSSRRLLIDLFSGNEFVGQTLANLKREDLSSAGIGDGYYGFTIDTGRRESDERVDAYVLDFNRRGLVPSDGRSLEISMERRRLTPRDYFIETFQSTVAGLANKNFEPLEHPGSYKLQENLLETNKISPSNIDYQNYFQRLIGYRWQHASATESFLSREQYDEFLKWYISVYGLAQRPFRVPLSKQDLLHLNSLANHPFNSRAERIFGETSTTLSGTNPQENAFLWGAYLAASFGIEDFSITEAHKRQLRHNSEVQIEFQVTPFIERFVAGNPFLARMGSSTSEDRALLYFIISLYAIRAPHLLLFFTKENFKSLFDRQLNPNNSSIFQRYCLSLFQISIEDPLSTLTNHFKTLQFDLDSLEFSTRTHNGSRLHVTALQTSEIEIADIQVIGPLTRGLGIGESCRRLAIALQSTEFNIRFCDFSIGHPNKTIQVEGIELARIGRAKINIIHLNLDELSDLLVYSPDVFSTSYNILMPYVEVAPPAEEQTYALKLIDEVWAATAFIQEAMKPYCKSHIVGAGIPDRTKITFDNDIKQTSMKFMFLVAADALSGIFRKNILGAVEAFLIAFPNNSDVKLVIKTHSTEKVSNSLEQAAWKTLFQIAKEDKRIEIIDKYLSAEEHSNLLASAGALISLHRAEGLGYHVLEGMLDEIPVVATACTGTTGFCLEDTAFIVPHKTVFVQNNQYVRVVAGQTWAEPDISIAAQKLKLVYENPVLAKQKAVRAKKFVGEHFSMDAFSARLRSRINSILGSLAVPR